MIYLRMTVKELEENIDFVKENNVGAEIPLYDTDYLNSVSFSEITRLGKLIEKNKIKTIVHLPMYGTNLGVKDKFIREYSLNVNIKALDIGSVFGASKAVFHNGTSPLEPPKVRGIWYNTFKSNFDKLMEAADKNKIMICSENVWDYDGEYFEFTLKNTGDRARFCFDIGHAHLYLTGVDHNEFMKKYGKNISHIHVHDNMLIQDDHYHIGHGNIDVEGYIKKIKEYTEADTFTLETTFDSEIKNDIEILRKVLSDGS